LSSKQETSLVDSKKQQQQDAIEVKQLPDSEKEEAYSIIDVFDEQQIRQELGGTLREDLVYEFPIGGKLVRGLSASGWTQVARMAIQKDAVPFSIILDKPVTEEREKSWKASVRVNLVYPNGKTLAIWGTKVQSKSVVDREGKVVKENDPNAEQIAESKAQRNALAKIFPPKTATEFMNALIKEGKIRALAPDEIEEAKQKARVVGRSQAKDLQDIEKLEPKQEEEQKPPPQPQQQQQQKKPPGGRSTKKNFPRAFSLNSPEFYELLDVPLTNLAIANNLTLRWVKDEDGKAIGVIFYGLPNSKDLDKTIEEIISTVEPLGIEEGRLD
jgi:hypothetical protein